MESLTCHNSGVVGPVLGRWREKPEEMSIFFLHVRWLGLLPSPSGSNESLHNVSKAVSLLGSWAGLAWGQPLFWVLWRWEEATAGTLPDMLCSRCSYKSNSLTPITQSNLNKNPEQGQDICQSPGHKGFDGGIWNGWGPVAICCQEQHTENLSCNPKPASLERSAAVGQGRTWWRMWFTRCTLLVQSKHNLVHKSSWQQAVQYGEHSKERPGRLSDADKAAATFRTCDAEAGTHRLTDWQRALTVLRLLHCLTWGL